MGDLQRAEDARELAEDRDRGLGVRGEYRQPEAAAVCGDLSAAECESEAFEAVFV